MFRPRLKVLPGKVSGVVELSLQQELSDFMEQIEICNKKTSREKCVRLEESAGDSDSCPHKLSETLFAIWEKYRNRLQKQILHSKLIEIGDFLLECKHCYLAETHCYSLALCEISSTNIFSITDGLQLEKEFFASGLDSPLSLLTGRALLGVVGCRCETLCESKAPIDASTICSVMKLLKFLQIFMQYVLQVPEVFWLVYNATVLMYGLCRMLMMNEHSAKAVEFLIWSCTCMEQSYPLLGVGFLSWRSTLYLAVCQCYIECEMHNNAEEFARRGLDKVHQLHEVEKSNGSANIEKAGKTFRMAAFKLGLIIFRRAVFTKRKKQKVTMRAKKVPLKDMAEQLWPRTQTERLLSDMFSGNTARFLAVLETLTIPRRRVLNVLPPSGPPEDKEVWTELFFAAVHLLNNKSEGIFLELGALEIGALNDDLVYKGCNGVSVSSLMKLIELLYSYHEWEHFHTVALKTRDVLRLTGTHSNHVVILDILIIMAPERETKGSTEPKNSHQSMMGKSRTVENAQEFRLEDRGEKLVEALHRTVSHAVSEIDSDIVIDATLSLWRAVEREYLNVTWGAKLTEMQELVLAALEAIHCVFSWRDLAYIDPVLTSVVALYFGLALEASAMNSSISMSRGYHVKACKLVSAALKDFQEIDKPFKTHVTLISDQTVSGRETIKDLHLVLVEAYYRISVKLAHLPPEPAVSGTARFRRDCRTGGLDQQLPLVLPRTMSELRWECGSCHLRRAIVCLADAAELMKTGAVADARTLMEDVVGLMRQGQQMETRLNRDESNCVSDNVVPPPPTLINRSASSATFLPAAWIKSELVAWYQLFARSAEGNMVKARFSDYHFPGTGVMPAMTAGW
ncbi:PREDICTED: cilia- and flagella-associated protein 54-like [Priapulus caudatus]|uniref:Cilia- and flagella-associated protein 54-like n=1 Tax=Priapulus caudatus TaxID=37621 RepID=A0ABM1DRI6_PRICU|nr:PREDICTED: cilia- and flagella-associated protein 54-like [Priapulus caudatus]